MIERYTVAAGRFLLLPIQPKTIPWARQCAESTPGEVVVVNSCCFFPFQRQCSACTKAIAVIGDVIAVDVNAPRQLRRPGVSIAQPSLETSSSTAVIAAATTTPITQATAAKRAAGRRSSPGASIATARPKRGRGSTRGRPRRVVAEAYPPSMDVEAMEDLQSLATVSSVDVSGVVRTHLKVEGGDEEFLALDENVDDEEEEAEFTDGEEDGSSSGSDDDDDENDGTSDSETSDIVEEKRGVVVEETMTPEHAEAVAVKVKVRSCVLFPPLLLFVTYWDRLLEAPHRVKRFHSVIRLSSLSLGVIIIYVYVFFSEARLLN